MWLVQMRQGQNLMQPARMPPELMRKRLVYCHTPPMRQTVALQRQYRQNIFSWIISYLNLNTVNAGHLRPSTEKYGLQTALWPTGYPIIASLL